jgi:ubiquinone/menaquinone biosynthesis C-methylase UbiE
VYGDITKLEYPDNTFEASYCISVIEHLPVDSIAIAINELLRVTRSKVLITLDIPIESSDGFNIRALSIFMEQFGIAIRPPITMFRIDNKPLGVYGIIFEKE